MGDKTGISWTDATWNPLRGCTKVSRGCKNCYAILVAYRFSAKGLPYEGLAHMKGGKPEWTNKVTLIHKNLGLPLTWKRPRRIFVNSTSDLFHEMVPFWYIDEVFATMALSPRHTFQVLTKRPARMLEYTRHLQAAADSWAAKINRPFTPADVLNLRHLMRHAKGVPLGAFPGTAWPLPNVWLGVSTEDQETYDERWPLLRDTAAHLRFVSYEPAVGPVMIGPPDDAVFPDWIIIGGESGKYADPFNIEWARDLIHSCGLAGISAFMKQTGARPYWPCVDALGEWADHVTYDTEVMPNGDRRHWIHLRDSHGGDPTEWPVDLRVQEFPA